MKQIKLNFRAALLVILTIIVIPADAYAKSACEDDLSLDQLIQIESVMTTLNGFYAQSRLAGAPKLLATSADAQILLALVPELEPLTLNEITREYALSLLTHVAICDGMVGDNQRYRAATGLMVAAAWITKERRKENLQKIEAFLPNRIRAPIGSLCD